MILALLIVDLCATLIGIAMVLRRDARFQVHAHEMTRQHLRILSLENGSARPESKAGKGADETARNPE